MFAEDYDMFAERRMLTKQQIIDEFYEYLSEKEREALDTYYQYSATTSSDKALLNWDKYMYYLVIYVVNLIKMIYNILRTLI